MAHTTGRYDDIVSACRSQSSRWLKLAFVSQRNEDVSPFAWRVSRTAIRQVLTERGEFPFSASEVEQIAA